LCGVQHVLPFVICGVTSHTSKQATCWRTCSVEGQPLFSGRTLGGKRHSILGTNECSNYAYASNISCAYAHLPHVLIHIFYMCSFTSSTCDHSHLSTQLSIPRFVVRMAEGGGITAGRPKSGCISHVGSMRQSTCSICMCSGFAIGKHRGVPLFFPSRCTRPRGVLLSLPRGARCCALVAHATRPSRCYQTLAVLPDPRGARRASVQLATLFCGLAVLFCLCSHAV
jgi:hypothetical protein